MHTTLVLTHECNLACTYCYMGEKFRRSMDWDTVLAGLELAFEGAGDVEVGFFGGEPLIEFDLLVRVCEHVRARAAGEGRRARFAVTTNGTLLTAARAARLAALGVELTLSLDGVREAHEATRPQRGGQSSFDAVVNAARTVLGAGMPLEVIAVVAPDNVRHLGASVRFLAELGARYVSLNPCFEQAWSDEALALWEQGMRDAAAVYAERMRAGAPFGLPMLDNKLLAAVKGGLAACDGCGAAMREIAVAPSGNLYPCARLVGEDRDTTLVIGHVGTGVDRARVRALRKSHNDPACEECAERWRCMAACMCANVAETGRPDTPGGTQCWYEQATARVADALGAELLAEGCEAFLRWTYGRVAEAMRAHDAVPPPTSPSPSPKTTQVRRVRRLPLLRVSP
jgi:uncharacterized protein